MTTMCEENVFTSFLMGGFECSTHRIRAGRRLDMIAATRHDELAERDYRRLMGTGMLSCRDGVRWHLIETSPYTYDFSSLMSQVRAARTTGMQVIWDLFHYGYPDDLDILEPEFVNRFAAFSRAAATLLKEQLPAPILFCPVNEISFFSWAAGRAGIFYPYRKKSAGKIKRQLVRAAIASIDAVLEIDPTARWVLTEPAIHVVPSKATPSCRRGAESYRLAQFEGYDMISGRLEPELGGHPHYLDIIGLNYYVHNQWTYPSRRPIERRHPLYKPPHMIFREIYERYQRPMILAETGIEDDRRAEWFSYIAGEVQSTRAAGVPLQALCLYPIVNHPGWEDSRHCHNGLWDYADKGGEREAYAPLLTQIQRLNARDNSLSLAKAAS